MDRLMENSEGIEWMEWNGMENRDGMEWMQ